MRILGRNISALVFLLHILFWGLWIISFTVIQSLGKDYNEVFIWFMYYIITLPIFVSHTYLIAYWLVPEYFLKRKFVIFTVLILALLVIFSIVELIASNELVFKVFDPSRAFSPGYLNPVNILASGVGNHYIILVFMAIKVVKSWHEAKNRKEELAQQNLETELEIYRYQLQPAFILSLVNELEQLSLENPKKLPEMIVKISDFINRLLFEAKAVLIPLETEFKLISDFLSIQELAIGKRLKNNLIVNGISSGRVIPPLLIFPFLNDACKVVNKCNDSFECTVIIKVEKKYILISFSLWSEKEFKVGGNVNMELIRKRLYFNYENKYRIIENEDANFKEISIEIFS
ncbi:MAG: histidine kinase [Prolixibacteraceae bacterium]|nr:histidine kinase [Prolixibacteraceae bacterium]MBN2775503.1 histidine kinase [Prolixibacteraceae bacterium]